MSPSSRYRRLRNASVACIAAGVVNVLWGFGMLLILPGWRTVVSWTAAFAAFAAADFSRRVLRRLREVNHR